MATEFRIEVPSKAIVDLRLEQWLRAERVVSRWVSDEPFSADRYIVRAEHPLEGRVLYEGVAPEGIVTLIAAIAQGHDIEPLLRELERQYGVPE